MNKKLTKFRLVNTDGLSGVHYKGRTIPFERIDDKLAEELIDKTHVLERIEPEAEPATAPVALALTEPAAEQPAALPEAPAGDKKKDE